MSQAYARVLSVPERREERQPSPQRRPSVRKRRRIDPAFWVSVGALVVLVSAMAHVAQKAQIASLSYELHRETLRLAEANRTRNHLMVEVEKARALGAIETAARARLGLVEPERVAWLNIGERVASAEEPPTSPQESSRSLGSALSDWFHRVRVEISSTF